MTNVARHAVANTCSVRLSVEAEGRVLRLEIKDDGVGLDASARHYFVAGIK
jgi:signal transduction histidine kinase